MATDWYDKASHCQVTFRTATATYPSGLMQGGRILVVGSERGCGRLCFVYDGNAQLLADAQLMAATISLRTRRQRYQHLHIAARQGGRNVPNRDSKPVFMRDLCGLPSDTADQHSVIPNKRR